MTRCMVAAFVLATALPIAAQSLDVAGVVNFVLEGPTADADGNVYFTDVNANRILKLDTAGAITTFRQPSNRANGMVFDTQFRLLAAEQGDSGAGTPARVTRTDMKTGKIEVLADSFDGKPFRGTNDITYDGQGRIWFMRTRGTSETLATKVGVHVFSPDGKLINHYAITMDLLTNTAFGGPDLRTLYVTAGNTVYKTQVKIPGTRR